MFINNEFSYIYDEPAKYKDLVFYPVTVQEYLEFNYYIDCLLIDKNSIADVRVISMSYLEYLVEATNDKTFYYQKLLSLLRLCLKLRDDYLLISEEQARLNYDSGKTVVISETNPIVKYMAIDNTKGLSWEKTIKPLAKNMKSVFYFEEPEKVQIIKKNGATQIQIKSSIYTASDFEEIRKIILNQNDVEQIDEKTSKAVRDRLAEKQKIANEMRGAEKFCDFENQLIYVSICLCCSLEDVKKMTIRKFKKYIARINHKMEYEIYTAGFMAAGVDGKKHKYPSHPMADLDSKNKYSDIFVEEEVLEKKTGTKIQRQK